MQPGQFNRELNVAVAKVIARNDRLGRGLDEPYFTGGGLKRGCTDKDERLIAITRNSIRIYPRKVDQITLGLTEILDQIAGRAGYAGFIEKVKNERVRACPALRLIAARPAGGDIRAASYTAILPTDDKPAIRKTGDRRLGLSARSDGVDQKL